MVSFRLRDNQNSNIIYCSSCSKKKHFRHSLQVCIAKFLRTPERPATLLKTDSNTGVSSEYCEIFKNTYFEEHLRTPASVMSFCIVLLYWKDPLRAEGKDFLAFCQKKTDMHSLVWIRYICALTSEFHVNARKVILFLPFLYFSNFVHLLMIIGMSHKSCL